MSWQLLVSLLVGACIGSFLNVVILRFGKKEGLAGRSHCPSCHRTLRWWELIPILSFLLLGARCATCHKSLTWQYPLVEFLITLIWGWAFWNASNSVSGYTQALLLAGIGTILLLLWIIDLKHFLLPDYYLVLLTSFVILKISITGVPLPQNALQGAAIGTGILFLIWAATSGNGLGFGDVKLMIPLGLLVGLTGTLTIVFLAFLSGGLTATFLLLSKRATLKTAVPFGPYLLAAAFAVLGSPELPQRLFASLF